MKEWIKKELIEWLKVIAMSIVMSMILISVVQPTSVKGQSMYPTIENGQYLIINKLSYKFNKLPQKGDIVVFQTELEDDNNSDGKLLIKRVIGTSGDHVKIYDGKVEINGEEIKENYINEMYTSGEVDTVVTEGNIFVMGDNRQNSIDSRFREVGMVNIDDIVGKAWIRLYPFNSIGIL